MIVKQQKPFPAILLDFNSYDGMKTLVAFIFILTILYFTSGLISLVFWEDKWWWPDTVHKTAIFSFRLFVLVIVYCITWLTFDRRSLEGYIFAIFSFVFGVVYIITPLDFIPDFVPALSAIDDAIVGGGSIFAAAMSYKKSTSKSETTENVKSLLKNGKDSDALKILLRERGLMVVDDD
jgi:uncharacterized membrane protein YkvA (DUF1232 family)